MKYDIRENGDSTITEIVFSDEDSLNISGDCIRFRKYLGEIKYVVHVSNIDNMIAALQKAKEVWL